MTGRHAISTIFGEQTVASGPGYPLWKGRQIVGDDFAVPVKIHDSLGVRVNGLVVASQPTAIGSLDPMRIRKGSLPRKKIAAGNDREIENRGSVGHSRLLHVVWLD
jgi:hypothetical protein